LFRVKIQTLSSLTDASARAREDAGSTIVKEFLVMIRPFRSFLRTRKAALTPKHSLRIVSLSFDALEERLAPASDVLRLASQAVPAILSSSAAGSSFTNNEGATWSLDSRFCVFVSDATNLVSGQSDSNSSNDIFLYDRILNSTRLVSSVAGTPSKTGNGGSFSPAISADGRFIAFVSFSSNLVAGQIDTNNDQDVFVFDRVAGTTQLVSSAAGSATVAGNGTGGGAVFQPAISGDGSFVAFASQSTNLVAGFVNQNGAAPDVFVFNRTAGASRLVSGVAGSLTNGGNGASDSPVMSADGAFVAFQSASSNLVSGQVDSNNDTDIFSFNRTAGTTRLVSGVAGSATNTGNAGSSEPLISSDGSFIAFTSFGSNLAPGQVDANSGGADIFVYNASAGTTRLVSGALGSVAVTANGASSNPVMSADGSLIAFQSAATNLIGGFDDRNGLSPDIFTFDRGTGTTRLVSGASGSLTSTGNGGSFDPAISANGAYVAFFSFASNVVAGQVDGNARADVFVYGRAAGTSRLASGVSGSTTSTGNNTSNNPVLSGNGAFVAYQSDSNNLVANDLNSSSDVFIWTNIPPTSTSTVVAPTTTTVYGQLTTLQATVSPNPGAGNGTISFFDNGILIPGGSEIAINGSGTATFQISTLPAGSHAITAIYNGSAAFDISPASPAVNKMVTPAPLTATPNPPNKVYDGSVNVTVSYALSGFVGSETVLATSGGTFASKDVGSGPVALGTISLANGTGGGLAANYFIANTPANPTGTISPKPLTITANPPTKAYDGAVNANVTYALSGLVGAETILASSSGTFAAKNVGTSLVTLGPLTLANGANGGLLSNYAVANTPANPLGTITPKLLTATVNSATKVYDGTTSAAITYALAGFVGAETVTASGSGAFASPNAGNVAVTLGPITLADGANGGLAANYAVSPLPANPIGTILPKPITATPIAPGKTYDGSASVTVSYLLDGLVGTESLEASSSGAFASPNAGIRTVTLGPITLANGANGGLASNYTITNAPANTTGAILPKLLTALPNLPVKFYDGSTSASADYTLSGLVGAETVIASGPATFASVNVGPSNVTFGPISLADGANGGLAANYVIANTPADRIGLIVAKPLAVTANDQFKRFGDTLVLTGTEFTTSGLVAGETIGSVTLSTPLGGAAAADPVGNYPIDPSFATGGNFDPSNYSITYVSGTLRVRDAFNEPTTTTVSPAAPVAYGSPLTLTATVSPSPGANNGSVTFVVDGNIVGTSVPVDASGAARLPLANLRAGAHAISAIYGGGAFLDPSVSAPVTQLVTPRALTTVGMTASDRIYDGDLFASLDISNVFLNGVLGADDVAVIPNNAAGAFADKNVGVNKSVFVSGLVLTGADAGNYALNPLVLTASISPLSVTMVGAVTPASRAYDGTTLVPLDLSAATVVGVGADVVQLSTAGATAHVSDKHVGVAKPVVISGVSLIGADAGNYTLVVPSLTIAITPRNLSATGISASDKPFDGSTTASLDISFAALAGVVPGDSVNLNTDNASADFDTPAVGAGKSVFVSGLAIDNNDYSLLPLTLSAAITSTVAPTATTTSLVANPLATPGGMLVTFTATVAPSPGAAGTVTFNDNGAPIPGGVNIAINNGVAMFTTSNLALGSHPITAAYSGDLAFAPSTSNTQTVTVAPVPTPPQILSVTPNGNIPALAGPQRSRIASLVVVFNQAVQLDANAFTLAPHTNNVVFAGVPQPTGYAALPSALVLATSDNKTWVITFSGNTDAGADGFQSLKDGVYDLNIAAAKVHPLGAPGVSMAVNSSTTFHRLFGDTSPPDGPASGPGGDFTALVNTGDNLFFRDAFNNLANYRAAFDFDGDGVINTGDNLEFRNRFNLPLSWSV
jgi:hypothetical protein